MSNDPRFPWVATTFKESGDSEIRNSEGKLIAVFGKRKDRDHALACVQVLNGIDPTKLPVVFETIRALSSVETIATAQEEAVLNAARAAGIIRSAP